MSAATWDPRRSVRDVSTRIAILDDDRPHTEFLLNALRAPLSKSLGATVCVIFDRGEQLRRALRRETFDLVILDWNLPDYDGLRLLRWLRERDALMPVLMLSARTLDGDVAGALLNGADDYITKPFRPLELRARVLRLLVRAQSGAEEQDVLRFGNWRFDRNSLVVIYRHSLLEWPTSPLATLHPESEATKLTDREFRLALALFRNLGVLVSRGYLSDVGGLSGPSGDSRSLDSHVYKLRKKLVLDGPRDLKLHTVYGRGYRLARTEPSHPSMEPGTQARDS